MGANGCCLQTSGSNTTSRHVREEGLRQTVARPETFRPGCIGLYCSVAVVVGIVQGDLRIAERREDLALAKWKLVCRSCWIGGHFYHFFFCPRFRHMMRVIGQNIYRLGHRFQRRIAALDWQCPTRNFGDINYSSCLLLQTTFFGCCFNAT